MFLLLWNKYIAITFEKYPSIRNTKEREKEIELLIKRFRLTLFKYVILFNPNVFAM